MSIRFARGLPFDPVDTIDAIHDVIYFFFFQPGSKIFDKSDFCGFEIANDAMGERGMREFRGSETRVENGYATCELKQNSTDADGIAIKSKIN